MEKIKKLKEHYDVIIIGGGLWGCMIQKYFNHRNISTLIIDNQEPMAGSKCAVGVFTENWLNKISNFIPNSFEVIEELVGINNADFLDNDQSSPIKPKKQLFFINPHEIINEKFYKARVYLVRDKTVFFKKKKQNLEITAKKAVIISAGFWTNLLLNQSNYFDAPILDRVWGMNYEISTAKKQKNHYWTWAPYKHALGAYFKNQKILKFSDGSTVKNPKVSDQRMAKVEGRLKDHFTSLYPDLKSEKITKLEGIRPYLKHNEFKYISQHDKHLFSATGARKNGVVLSGYIAWKLYEVIFNKAEI